MLAVSGIYKDKNRPRALQCKPVLLDCLFSASPFISRLFLKHYKMYCFDTYSAHVKSTVKVTETQLQTIPLSGKTSPIGMDIGRPCFQMNNFPNKQNVILMVKNCILFSLMLHFSKLRTARTAPCISLKINLSMVPSCVQSLQMHCHNQPCCFLSFRIHRELQI